MLSFDAGNAGDDRVKPGTQALMLSLLDEGTKTRSATEIAESVERLGASIGAGAGMDRTRVSMSALVPNLAASLDLMADIVRNPEFAPAELERVRQMQLARIRQEGTQPQAIALRELPPLMYGKDHPYGVPFTGSGTTDGVKSVTRDDLVAFHRRWIRPDNASVFVVGDTSLAELLPLLESRFGSWTAPAEPLPVKRFPAVRPPAAKVVLIDRPGAPQSLILAGYPLGAKGTDDALALYAANDIVGGSFTSRLNADLREAKGWAYGVSTSINTVREQMPLFLFAPVQTDRTADSIRALTDGLATFRTTAPPTPDEIARMINNNVRSLPGSFETASDVLGSIERNYTFGRPDDYQERLAARYTALTAADLTAAAQAIDPAKLTWIVVGDRRAVAQPLRDLGIPLEVR
jgi:predicted Zn-dependent peptidase